MNLNEGPMYVCFYVMFIYILLLFTEAMYVYETKTTTNGHHHTPSTDTYVYGREHDNGMGTTTRAQGVNMSRARKNIRECYGIRGDACGTYVAAFCTGHAN